MQGSFLEPVHKERYSYQPHDAKLISLIDDDKDRTVSQNAETESKKVRYILLLSHDRRNDGWMEKASLKEIPIGVQGTDIPVQKHHSFIHVHAPQRGEQLRPTHVTLHIEHTTIRARVANEHYINFMYKWFLHGGPTEIFLLFPTDTLIDNIANFV